MKTGLNWHSREVVSIYNDLLVWSAPFGQILLENIPIQGNQTIVDLGSGAGFPLFELAQRFGSESIIYSVDPWEEAQSYCIRKGSLLGLKNITFMNKKADQLALAENSVDLFCSNLGVNNFENIDAVSQNIFRMLKPNGNFCFTTNDTNTFKEIYQIFSETLDEMNASKKILNAQINARPSSENIIQSLQKLSFELIQCKATRSSMRFATADSFFDHALIRTAFMPSWQVLVPEMDTSSFFNKVKKGIQKVIQKSGHFETQIPVLYFHFKPI